MRHNTDKLWHADSSLVVESNSKVDAAALTAPMKFTNYLTKLQLFIVLFSMLLGISCLVIQYINPIHFPSTDTMPITALSEIVLIAVTMASCNYFKQRPYLTRVLEIISMFFISVQIVQVGIVGMMSIQLTPFAPIDHWLVSFDNIFGFSTVALLNWTSQHSFIKHVLYICYESWIIQVFFVPILFAAMGRYKNSLCYSLAFLLSLLLTGCIYFFWPTLAPAGVFHSSHFTIDQVNLAHNFYLRRAGVIKLLPCDGLVSFPSPHVIGACLVVMLAWPVRYLRYPLIVLNCGLIFSTMALGYHYLADVLGAIIVSGVCFYVSSCFMARQS